ncbi:MAG: hypothetical protein ACRDLB_13595 [Actinomycetota bacterium]
MERQRGPGDYFDRARVAASAGLIAAGAAAVIGSVLDWVTVTPPERGPASELARAEPFTGIEARDGWYVIGCAAVLIACAFLVVARKKGGFAWLAFAAAFVMGVIAIADYRAIDDITSDISRRMDLVGDAQQAVGLILVLVAAFVGIVASLAGVAATPRE